MNLKDYQEKEPLLPQCVECPPAKHLYPEPVNMTLFGIWAFLNVIMVRPLGEDHSNQSGPYKGRGKYAQWYREEGHAQKAEFK